MTFFNGSSAGNPVSGRMAYVYLSQAGLDALTDGDPDVFYILNESPYTKYVWTSGSLKEVNTADNLVDTTALSAQLNGLQAQINAINALIGSSSSPSKPTVVANTAFAGSLAINVDQTITPAKWSGSTVTISNASPAVVSHTAHGRQVGDQVIYNTTGALPAGVTAGAIYYVISAGFGANSYQISATPGGSAINTSSAGSGTHTIDGVIPSSRVWHVYINGVIDSANPNRVTNSFTPSIGHAGLVCWVIEEATARNGSGQVLSTSVPVTVAAPATFTVTVVQGTISGTEGQAITPIAPVVASGATGSVYYTTTPNLSGTGFSIDSATGVISGTRTLGLGALSATYNVNASDSATAPDFIFASFTFNISAATVQPFAQLPYPADINVTGTSGSYNGTTPITVSSVNRVFPVTHSSGVVVDGHRIVQGYSGSVRGEVMWIGSAGQAQNFVVGHEWWYAFTISRRSGELSPDNGVYNEILVTQHHWGGYGATQPELALFDFGYYDASNRNYFRWRASGSSTAPGNYADHGGSGTNNWHDTSEPGYVNPWITDVDTRPAAGVTWRYVVRYKGGWDAGHDKIIQIWRGKPGEDMVNITTGGIYTGINEYNDNNNGLSIPGYLRKGPYTDSTLILAPTIGYDISRYYIEENNLGASSATMLARATQSVAWAR